MITFLLILTGLSVLIALFVLVLFLGARQAAKDAVVDTMRLDAVINRHMELSWGEDAWRIGAGTSVHFGRDLRDLIDVVDNVEANRG